MEIDAMLAQELGLLVTGADLQRNPLGMPPTVFRGNDIPRPVICAKASKMFENLRKLFGVQAGLPFDFAESTEVQSLTTFLDEDIPKNPFSPSPQSSDMWTQVAA
jgi:hypothetical protein